MNPQPLPLRDIHLPEPIGFWPPAIGWWLAALGILVLLVSMVWLIRRLTRKTALKSARRLLAELKQDPSLDSAEKVVRLSILLRRVTISLAPREQSAGLTGQAWLNHLDASLPDQPFSTGIGRQLIEIPYRNELPPETDVSELFELCERWLKAQKRNKR
ncbi:DUF4381 domain-containing protein [Methylotuvimicrobium sp. KM2]|jgi:hypothetical protein|uniref:DUF4381 domain-containing protein n=1 Tax=Methylotuvimicrobium sp. KM2 TaxID=3133976 RepID=UPI003100BABC